MPRSSFDLIYARPGQTARAWRAELADALAFAGGHLSLYQLTIEKGTPFWREARDGAFALPDDDEARALYDLTQEMTMAAGFAAYEVSNHAREGDAPAATTSPTGAMTITRGIGPGAHGRIRRGEGTAGDAPARGPGGVARRRRDVRPRHRRDPRSRSARAGARDADDGGSGSRKGVSETDLEARTGCDPDRVIDRAGPRPPRRSGLPGEPGAPRLRATAAGRPLLNGLLVELLA